MCAIYSPNVVKSLPKIMITSQSLYSVLFSFLSLFLILKTIKQDLNIKNSDKKENKTEYNDYDAIIILGKDFKTFGE